MPAWLAGAFVQKVGQPIAGVMLLGLRLPSRSVTIALIAGVIGPANRATLRSAGALPASAETMRWRALLEGARVVQVRSIDEHSSSLLLVRDGEWLLAETSNAALRLSTTPTPAIDDQTGILDEYDEHRLAELVGDRVLRMLSRLFQDRQRRLLGAIDRASKRLVRRIESVRSDLAKIGDASALIARGALLAQVAHGIRRGSTEAIAIDWSSGDAVPVTIALDPALSAREQAEAMLHRGKRLKRGLGRASARLLEAQALLVQLGELRASSLSAPDDESIARCERLAASLAASPPSAGSFGKTGTKQTPRSPFVTYRIGDHRVLVGRGAKDNDTLTTKIARPHDLWLHAKGHTGAHVVVPLAKGAECPPDLLIDAAHLAAHFSDARGELVVDVAWAERRYVRKPRGSAPGAVLIDRERVIGLRVEPARIERLLRSVE